MLFRDLILFIDVDDLMLTPLSDILMLTHKRGSDVETIQ